MSSFDQIYNFSDRTVVATRSENAAVKPFWPCRSRDTIRNQCQSHLNNLNFILKVS